MSLGLLFWPAVRITSVYGAKGDKLDPRRNDEPPSPVATEPQLEDLPAEASWQQEDAPRRASKALTNRD